MFEPVKIGTNGEILDPSCSLELNCIGTAFAGF